MSAQPKSYMIWALAYCVATGCTFPEPDGEPSATQVGEPTTTQAAETPTPSHQDTPSEGGTPTSAPPVDWDGDGYFRCGDEQWSTADSPCDCDDTSAKINPGVALDTCGLGDEDCDGFYDEDPPVDNDNDGFTRCNGECDDSNAQVFPGAAEVPADDIDQDCNGWDLGNCATELLGQHRATLTVHLQNCAHTDQDWWVGEAFVNVPASARCGAGRMTWEGSYTFVSGAHILHVAGNWNVGESTDFTGTMTGDGSSNSAGNCTLATVTF